MFQSKRSVSLLLVITLVILLFISGCSSKLADDKNSSAAAINSADLQQATIRVSGMTCSSCPFTVKTAMERVDGVSKVSWESLKGSQGTAHVEFNKGSDVQKIKQAVLDLGYKAE